MAREAASSTLDDVLSLHALLPLAWQAARSAGAFLRDERPEALAIEAKSTATDAVTAMDRGAEARIVASVSAARPDDGFLGEEGGERRGTTGVRWIVDPLDGTVNYLARLPMWGVSIGIEVDGIIEVGVVVAPALRESYLAVRGAGAWALDGEEPVDAVRIAASDVQEPSMALVATGFGYEPRRREAQADAVRALIAQVRDIRRLGAASVDFCWTARGRLDAYYESGLQPWDIAAGALIAREAGAVVGPLRGEDDSVGTIAACAPGIADTLLPLLRSVDAAQ